VPINTVAVDPLAPDTIYAGNGNPPTQNGALLQSTQGGAQQSWKAVGAGIRNLSIPAFAASATTAEIYAGLYGGIVKTTDSGQTWPRLLNSGAFIALAVDPSTPSTVYAGTLGFGFYKSANSGASWATAINGIPANLTVLWVLVDPTAPATVYIGSSFGVYKSTDGAASWKSQNTNLPSTSVFMLALDRSAAATLFAATGNGMFRSTDAAGSWASSGSGLPAGTIFAVAIDPASPQTVYAGTSSGPYKSVNGGASWSPANSGASATVLTFAFDSPRGLLYAGTSAGVFVTSDAGATWTPLNASLTSLTINILAFDSSGALYAATDGAGVFRLLSSSPDRQPPVERSRQRPPTRPLGPRR
jgi:photosystem II stability/assembly factor-like uncharacterized protein